MLKVLILTILTLLGIGGHKNTLETQVPLDQLVPPSRVSITKPEDISKKRAEIIDYIWKDKKDTLSRLPDKVEKKAYGQKEIQEDPLLQKSDNLDYVDVLTINMEYNVNSSVKIYHPKTPREQLVIYHHGHGFSDKPAVCPEIAFFLDNNYTVMVFAMPLEYDRSVQLPNGILLKYHDDFRLIETETFSPLKFFLEPTWIGLNYAQSEGYHTFYMVGHSGGALTTLMYAAIDPRIQKSYAVAGPLPRYMEELVQGDYEINRWAELASYLDFYTLSGYGNGRSSLQIFNKYDACCNQVDTRLLGHEIAVKEQLQRLGDGSFNIFVDDTTQGSHSTSPHTLDVILADMNDSPTFSNTIQDQASPDIYAGIQVIPAEVGKDFGLSGIEGKVTSVKETTIEAPPGYKFVEVEVELTNKINQDRFIYYPLLLMEFTDDKGNKHFTVNIDTTLKNQELPIEATREGLFTYEVPDTAQNCTLVFWRGTSRAAVKVPL